MLLPKYQDHEMGLYFDAQPEGLYDTFRMIRDLRKQAERLEGVYDKMEYNEKRREAILARAAAIEEYMEIRLGWRKPARPESDDFLMGG